MHSTDEWIGAREQIIAEREGGFDNDYSEWLAQFDGDYEQSTLEQKYSAVTRPEYELLPVREPSQISLSNLSQQTAPKRRDD